MEEDSDGNEDELKFEDFFCVRRDDDGDLIVLEILIMCYKGKNEKGEEVIVDLIGVVYIGEGDYYVEFNKVFEGYDVLFYEFVVFEGMRIFEGGVREFGFNLVLGL